MTTPPEPRDLQASAPRPRTIVAIVVVLAAGLLAWGCGDDGGSSDRRGSDGTTSADDAGAQAKLLAWLPSGTLLVASTRIEEQALDRALRTLSRLPAWALVEAELPASDGPGLRRELLVRGAEAAAGPQGGAAPAVSPARLERALGAVAGVAVTSGDVEALDGDEPPLLAWAAVRDAAAAEAVAKDLTRGRDEPRSHRGIRWFESPDGVAWLVDDGLLLAASSGEQLERIIEARAGGRSLARDEEAAAALDRGVDDALVGLAVQGDVAREAAALVARGARSGSSSTAGPDRRLEDGDGPSWVTASATIDEVGVRVRSTWSDARELPQTRLGARELVERLPATTRLVAAAGGDGTGLRRAQAAWGEAITAAGVGGAGRSPCGRPPRWACTAAVAAARALLVDEQLADALAEAGPGVSALVVTGARAGAATVQALTTRRPLSRAGARGLVTAAAQTGVELDLSAPGEPGRLHVRPRSPLGRSVGTGSSSPAQAVLAALGVDADRLLSTRGLRLASRTVADVRLTRVEPSGAADVAAALAGDGDLLLEQRDYTDVVAAARPPRDVGAYGWLDVRATAVAALEQAGRGNPDILRAVPTVRNNLASAPGLLWWSARERDAGATAGALEVVLPILE